MQRSSLKNGQLFRFTTFELNTTWLCPSSPHTRWVSVPLPKAIESSNLSTTSVTPQNHYFSIEPPTAHSLTLQSQALFDLKMSNRVDHVVYITMDPYSSEGGDRETNATAPDGVLPAGHSTAIALFIEAGIKVISAAEVLSSPTLITVVASSHFQPCTPICRWHLP